MPILVIFFGIKKYMLLLKFKEIPQDFNKIQKNNNIFC